MKKSFILYTDDRDVFDILTDEQAGQLIKAIFHAEEIDENDLDPLIRIAFVPIKNKLLRDNEKWEEVRKARVESGRLGGLAKASKSKQKVANAKSVKQNVANLPVNVNVNVNGNVNVIKHKYGEYQNVLLTDAEMEKLKTEFPSDYQKRIDNLSAYMKSTGKSYKDHLATIRNWARKEKPVVKQNSFNTFDNKQDYSEVLRRLGE